jgi:hypothetical protein
MKHVLEEFRQAMEWLKEATPLYRLLQPMVHV